MENRIKDLEQKVEALEFQVKQLQNKPLRYQQPSQPQINRHITEYPTNKNVTESPTNRHIRQARPKKSFHIQEALVGKYLIGALSSILVFVAAISLVSLFWGQLTDALKLGLISIVGLVLTGVGFTRILKTKNNINSIILGTGAGILFISILSAHMAFDYISSNMAIILAGLWSVAFILSYKYTQTYFTTIIAYIGSYIALLMGLGMSSTPTEFIVLTIFTTGISLAMLITSKKWTESKLTLSILLTMLSYYTLMFVGVLKKGFDGDIDLVVLGVILTIIYVLANYLYRLIDTKGRFPWYIGIGILTSLFTVLFFAVSDIEYINILIIFYVINMAQFLLVLTKTQHITSIISKYFIAVLILVTYYIHLEQFRVPFGITSFAIILLIIDKITKEDNRHAVIINILLLIDSLTLALQSLDGIFDWGGYYADRWDNIETIFLAFIVYWILQTITITYIIYRDKEQTSDLTKVVGAIIYMINIPLLFREITNKITYVHVPDVPYEYDSFKYYDPTFERYKRTGEVLAYVVSTITIITLTLKGYFKDWIDHDRAPSQIIKTLFMVITTIMYFTGLTALQTVDFAYEGLIIALALIAIMLLQSKNIIENPSDKPIGVWLGLKYLIYTWAVLDAFFSIDISSVIMSVAGLVIALSSISAGFKLRIKSLRLYGLILTVLMVAKFILIDLGEQNSMTRVIALLIGGLICFGISVIYNKLNKQLEG